MSRHELPELPQREPSVMSLDVPPVQDYLSDLVPQRLNEPDEQIGKQIKKTGLHWLSFVILSASFGYGIGFVFAWLLANGEITVNLNELKEIYRNLRSLLPTMGS